MNEHEIRERLEQRRAELEALIAAGRDAAKPVQLDQSAVGRLSRMDAIQGQAMSQAAQERRKLDLMRVKAALSRLEEGSYGDCLECGEPIAAKRLLHDPVATHCVNCARAHRS